MQFLRALPVLRSSCCPTPASLLQKAQTGAAFGPRRFRSSLKQPNNTGRIPSRVARGWPGARETFWSSQSGQCRVLVFERGEQLLTPLHKPGGATAPVAMRDFIFFDGSDQRSTSRHRRLWASRGLCRAYVCHQPHHRLALPKSCGKGQHPIDARSPSAGSACTSLAPVSSICASPASQFSAIHVSNFCIDALFKVNTINQ